jgi:hypothetical protein
VLTAEESAWLGTNNAWYEAAYRQPDAAVFDRTVNPITECWFKSSAVVLLSRVEGYLALLDEHGVAWERVESEAPGRVVYEDAVQVVVALG